MVIFNKAWPEIHTLSPQFDMSRLQAMYLKGMDYYAVAMR